MEIIMKYIATWCWQLLAIKFLIGAILLFAMPRTLITQSFYVAFFLIFIGCQYMALKRKKELYENE